MFSGTPTFVIRMIVPPWRTATMSVLIVWLLALITIALRRRATVSPPNVGKLSDAMVTLRTSPSSLAGKLLNTFAVSANCVICPSATLTGYWSNASLISGP